MTSLSKKGPIFKKKFKGIEVALWKREHEGKTYYSVSNNRSFRDKDGDWQNSNSFDLESVDLLIDYLQQAKRLGEEYRAADREKRRQEDEAQAA
jgi:hypothetical protein